MGKDRIFEELGETLGRTAKMIGEKADDFMEIQKFYSRSAAERRQIGQGFKDLGELIYRRYVDGETMDLEAAELCDKITGHKVMLARYEEEIARRKGCKICPACGRSIGKTASYCSYCGAHCEEDECRDQKEESADEEEVLKKEADAAAETEPDTAEKNGEPEQPKQE